MRMIRGRKLPEIRRRSEPRSNSRSAHRVPPFSTCIAKARIDRFRHLRSKGKGSEDGALVRSQSETLVSTARPGTRDQFIPRCNSDGSSGTPFGVEARTLGAKLL